jgi:tetratricopeptide (TPR) repeat protein
MVTHSLPPVQALFAQGLTHHGAGNWQQAFLIYEQLQMLGVDDPSVWFAHGLARQLAPTHDGGSLERALQCYECTLGRAPKHAQAWLNRGVVQAALGDREAAISSYSSALEVEPGLALALFNRALAQHELKRFQAAITDYEQALALSPQEASWLYNLADAWHQSGQLSRALDCYDRALALRPDYAEASCNRGIVLRALGRPGDAVASFEQALKARPEYPEAYSNRGLALRDEQALDAANHSFHCAIALRPHYANAHLNQAFTKLLEGRYREGFAQYEWRWQSSQSVYSAHPFKHPLWLGQPCLEGKRLLVHAEQGLGDSLQFVRFALVLAQQGATVIVAAPQALKQLFRQLPGLSEVILDSDMPPAADFRCPMMSLPLALNTTLESVPFASSYLRPSPQRFAHWQQWRSSQDRLAPASAKRTRGLWIGLVWRGRPEHGNDRLRSMTLAQLVPHLPRQHRYVALQPELAPQDLQCLAQLHAQPDPEGLDITHLGAQLRDFDDTAALCMQLDGVIAVDTSVAHLAGGLGRPTAVLLPYSPDWRWMLARSDSPWYRSMTLLRQARHADWDSSLCQLSGWLAQREAERDNEPSPRHQGAPHG